MTVARIGQTVIDRSRSRGYFKHPRSSVEPVNLRPFFILGEVEKRGSCPYSNGLAVAQIRAASSELLSAFSNASAMFLVFLANRHREMGDCSAIGQGKTG